MPIKLLHNLVAVRPEEEKVTAGGILLTKPQKQPRGTVVAVGPGRYTTKGELIATTVKVGDFVVYNNSENVVEVDGEKLVLINEDNIIGVIR